MRAQYSGKQIRAIASFVSAIAIAVWVLVGDGPSVTGLIKVIAAGSIGAAVGGMIGGWIYGILADLGVAESPAQPTKEEMSEERCAHDEHQRHLRLRVREDNQAFSCLVVLLVFIGWVLWLYK